MTITHQRGRAILVVLAAGMATLAAPANACVVLPVTVVGKPLSAKAQARKDAVQARKNAAAELARIRADLQSGRVDAAVGLANVLIPNVRPTRIRADDCGGGAREIPDISPDNAADLFFRGTELEGLGPDTVPPAFRREMGDSYGAACNAEFRARFAALLHKRFRRASLNKAYVTLDASSGVGRERYYRFVGDRPEPPVTLDTNRFYPVMWFRMRGLLGPGRPLSRVVADFWAEIGQRAVDDSFACPTARRDWFAARDAALAKMRTDAARYDRLSGVAKRIRGNTAPTGTPK